MARLMVQRLFNRSILQAQQSSSDNSIATVIRCLSSGNNGNKNIPLPTNVEEIDAGHKAQFSRQRSRDISGPAIHPTGGTFGPGFMSSADHTASQAVDAHLSSYDCSGAVSLNSVMQTNVPEPFSAQGKAPTHLNMPGGQWSQEDKYLSQERQDAKAAKDTPLPVNYTDKNTVGENVRNFSTSTHHQSQPESSTTNNSNVPLSTKEKLKRAVKEYGATVIVFHVTISLMSLGTCYLAVSSGLDVATFLDKIGLGGYAVATGASTFVVAYAVHKVFAPVRISITLGATPFIVRYLRQTGFLKTPKPKLE